MGDTIRTKKAVADGCPNTCEQSLATIRRTALITYRNIQSGIRKKTEILMRFRNHKSLQQKSYDSLVEERKALLQLLTRMKFLLHDESHRENLLRWQLLRERENHCASGYPESCNYFFSEFVYEDELLYEGYPFVFSPANKKKRIVWEYNPEELRLLSKLKGIQKVKEMICPYRYLLPDDNSRIFIKINEYLDFMESPQGYASTHDQNRLIHKRMKDNSYFAQFLENGEKGYIAAAVVFWEFIGLALSPITLPFQVVVYCYQESKEWIWKQLQRNEAFYEQYLTTYFSEFYHNDTLSIVERDRSMENPFLPSSTSSSLTDGDTTIVNQPPSSGMFHKLQYYFFYFLKSFTSLILDIDREYSTIYYFFDFFDLERYSFTSYLLDKYYQYSLLPKWILRIMLRSPKLYYDYYMKDQGKYLPQRRNPCLLRQGIKTTEEELITINHQIKDYQEMKELLLNNKLQYFLTKETENNSPVMMKEEAEEEKKKSLYSSVISWIRLTFFTKKELKPKKRRTMITSSQKSSKKKNQRLSSDLEKLQQLNRPSFFSRILSVFSIDTLPSSSSLSSPSLSLSFNEQYYQNLQRLYLDYGKENEWEAIDNLCISSMIQQYNYSFCFFHEIKQDYQISLGKFSHWGINLIDLSFQQFPSFYPLISKYSQLYSSSGSSVAVSHTVEKGLMNPSTGKGEKKEKKDLNRLLSLSSFINIYDILDEIEEKSAVYYASNYYYQQFHSYFLNNSYYQYLKNNLTPEELTRVASSVSSLLSGKSRGSNDDDDEGEGRENEQKRIKETMISFYHSFFPFLDPLTYTVKQHHPVVTSSSSPSSRQEMLEKERLTEEKNNLLKEQLHLYYSQQVYDDGTECQGKPGFYRKTKVYFDCGPENAIKDVKEYEVNSEFLGVNVLICCFFVRFVPMK
jgi:hypothetical protein